MSADFERLLEHAAWADHRVMSLINAAPGARRAPVLRLFAHVLAAERIWLLRLRGRDTAREPIWPAWTPVELNAVVASNRHGYHRFLRGLDHRDPVREVEYANSQGIPFRTLVGDILAHVALHGSYHRGQIAAALRGAGEEPVNTDFITFAREGAVRV